MKSYMIVLMIGIVLGLLASWAWTWPRVREWRDALLFRMLMILGRIKGEPKASKGETIGPPDETEAADPEPAGGDSEPGGGSGQGGEDNP